MGTDAGMGADELQALHIKNDWKDVEAVHGVVRVFVQEHSLEKIVGLVEELG